MNIEYLIKDGGALALITLLGDNMSTFETFIDRRAIDGLLSWFDQLEVSKLFDMPIAETEGRLLEYGVLPARYQRNKNSIPEKSQLTLFRSKVAVVGCGGLGGYVVEELARLGVGSIIAIDHDVFEEHNLNRQLLSSLSNLGHPKVSAAVKRVAEINPAVSLVPHQKAFSRRNAAELLAGSHVVVDALDSISTRIELAGACASMNIPLVHGAIAGWFGQVATIFPGEKTMEYIYQTGNESQKGVEHSLGNPSFTPAVVASLMVAEACKLLLGEGTSLRLRHLIVDLLQMEMHVIEHNA